MPTLKVPDMTCGHCAATVEKAVKAIDPAASVTVDLKAHTVTVESKAELDSISGAIRSAGYDNERAA